MMNEFLGVKNVVDAVAILGNDGKTDGFKIVYQESRKVKVGKKVFNRTIEKEIVKYIREFDPHSVKSDGSLHGFGNKIVYSRKNPKSKVVKMTANGLASVARFIGGK